MNVFPDMQIHMDDLSADGDKAIYKWTLAGTNTGPGGTGQQVRISGYEAWKMNADGLTAESQGHFDKDAYQRRLERGHKGVRDA